MQETILGIATAILILWVIIKINRPANQLAGIASGQIDLLEAKQAVQMTKEAVKLDGQLDTMAKTLPKGKTLPTLASVLAKANGIKNTEED